MGAKSFSIFDATKGFFHKPFKESSKLHTAVIIPSWCIHVYFFHGTSYSGDLFEPAFMSLLAGLNGVVNIADDILVYGTTQEQYDTNLTNFLEMSRH